MLVYITKGDTMAIPVEVMASKKIIYIDRDEYHPDDNPLSIEGNPFTLKI